jgi:hypothetical protein
VTTFTRKPPEEDVFAKTPLTWTVLRTTEGWSALAVCPNGHAASLDDHTIADDGVVTPSVVCPTKDCGFHDSIKLEGWLDG